jgi:hypothetical protein
MSARASLPASLPGGVFALLTIKSVKGVDAKPVYLYYSSLCAGFTRRTYRDKIPGRFDDPEQEARRSCAKKAARCLVTRSASD